MSRAKQQITLPSGETLAAETYDEIVRESRKETIRNTLAIIGAVTVTYVTLGLVNAIRKERDKETISTPVE